MKNYLNCFLFFVLLLTPCFLMGQQNKTNDGFSRTIDSLLTVLKTAKEDTAKINTLNALTRQFTSSGLYEKAFHYAFQEKLQAEKLNYKKGIASAYNNIGAIYYSQSNYPEALKNFLTSLNIREEIKDKQGIANSYNNIGNIYYSQGSYPEALKNYFAALKIREEIKDKHGIAMSYNNIGAIYAHQGNYPEALKNHFASLKLREEIKDKLGIANTYNNIGNIYGLQHNYSEALKNYSASLKMQDEIGNKQGIAYSYNNIGDIYEHQSNYSEALKNYFASSKLRGEIGDKQGIAFSYINIGDIYMKLDKIEESNRYLNQALDVSKEIGNKDGIKEAYAALSQLYDKKGDYKLALNYHKLFSDIKDTLLNEQSNKQIAEMNTKYETDKKEKEIELLTNETKLKETELTLRNLIIAGVILISFLLFVSYNRYHVKQKLTAEKEKLIIEKQFAEIEQKLLRLQMNPHFIFNALTAVQGFINSDKKNEAGVYLSKISRLIRAILENSREEYIPFEKELQSLENYLNINQLLMDNEFEYKIEIDDDIDKEQTLIPPMLAQPFIENALKHGLQNENKKGLIVIRFNKKGKTILFEVEDNGIGLSKSKAVKTLHHQSLATIITKERLANLFRVSLDKIQISVNEEKNAAGAVTGTKTTFEMPAKFI